MVLLPLTSRPVPPGRLDRFDAARRACILPFSIIALPSALCIISPLPPIRFPTMHAPLYVTPPMMLPLPDPVSPGREIADLLRQVVSLQQEQIGLLKVQLAGQDSSAKWRSFLSRWESEFPQIGPACKQALPVLERAYLGLVQELTERVNSGDAAELNDEFVLGEFLDRFGIRLGQLGNILGQLAPLAEVAPAPAGNG